MRIKRRKDRRSVSVELKEDYQNEQITQKITAFDYDRLYRGKLRNKIDNNSENEENNNNELVKEKKWKGHSERFMIRNLKNKNKININNEIDDILTEDENDKMRIEKERITRENAAKFLERQQAKILEAQKKAQERIDKHRNKDILERKRLAKKREEARILALKVAEKIAQRQENENNMKSLSLEKSSEIQLETQSDPCLNFNLFDKLRKKGISNENFIKNENEMIKLNSHRSMDVFDKYKKDKKRSLQVTGKILKVLSD
eukprot:461307_1